MGYQSDNYGREPAWRSASARLRREVPAELAPWLFDCESLTRRLQQTCGAGFRVRLLGQRWQRPMLNERRRLGMGNREYGLVRQVRLLCGHLPVVFARTVMPVATIRGTRRRLAHLGHRPLGATLFADKSMRRDGIEIARITPDHDLYAAATGDGQLDEDAIWGRRSVFRIKDRPLLVSEIFVSVLPHPAR